MNYGSTDRGTDCGTTGKHECFGCVLHNFGKYLGVASGLSNT